MKVVIVNCFDTYEDRVDLLHEFFLSKGHDVSIIQSDFRHIQKTKRTDNKNGFLFVESRPYYKNLSIARMRSHYNFAQKAFKLVADLNPDLLYVTVPPNSLAKLASEYKKKNKNVRLIFDLIDLWPETMPIGQIKQFPPFTLWKGMRDKSFKFADLVITECNLYKEILEKELKSIKTETVYLAKKDVHIRSNPKLSEDRVHLCYLGSINNIIDIPKIKKLIESLNQRKPTTLHIIGDGESKNTFIKEIESTGATVVYHGKIYDPNEKQGIFDICHFGLNIMKDNVCVGLTMKSIDYFQAGLPILNTIQGDTYKIVENCNIGFNVTDEKLESITCNISDELSGIIAMRKNSRDLFVDMFSLQAFNRRLEKVLN